MNIGTTRTARHGLLRAGMQDRARAARRSAFAVGALRGLADRGFALLALLFFSPFILAVALAILICDGRPLFFGQRRIGKDGRYFTCLKFRTMSRDADQRLKVLLDTDPRVREEWERHQKLDNDPRVNCLGRFLRKSSMDELPQFLNVLRGDMALVGPRPIIDEETHHYGDHLADYMSVKPGLTGHWQVSGRSDTTYAERVAMDVDYIRNRSIARDAAIVARTVKVVLTGRGAS